MATTGSQLLVHTVRIPGAIEHAAQRWARVVVAGTRAREDPKTFATWGRCVGASGSALRQWSYAAGVQPRASITFVRLLRAVLRSDGSQWDPQNVLDVIDTRTLHKLLVAGGLDTVRRGSTEIPPPREFLQRQGIITDMKLLSEVARELDASSTSSGRRASPTRK